jgi:hypothetical protein
MTKQLHGWAKDPRTNLVTNIDHKAYQTYLSQLEQYKQKKALESRLAVLEAKLAKLLDQE